MSRARALGGPIGGDPSSPADLLSADGMWLSASRGITLDVGVTSWVDQMPDPVTFSQTTDAAEPALNASPARVTFDGTADFMQAASAAKHQWGASFYLAGWVRRNGTASGDKYLWSQWDTSDVEQLIVRDRADLSKMEVLIAINGTSFSTLACPNLPTGAFTFLEVIYDGGQAVANDRLKVFFDGVEQSALHFGTHPTSVAALTASARISSLFGTTGFGPIDVSSLYSDPVLPDAATRATLMAFEDPS